MASSKLSRSAVGAAIGTALTLAFSTIAFAPAFATPVAPAIHWTTTITDGSHYGWGTPLTAPTCEVTSVVAETETAACVVTGFETTVGEHTLTATATVSDSVETATTTETRTYTIDGYAATFYAPLKADVTMVQPGRTLPLKFKVWYDQARTQKAKSRSVVTSFVATEFLCTDTSVVLSQKDLLASSKVKYRDGAFHINWKVAKPAKVKGKKLPGPQVCGVVTVTTEDGSSFAAKFQLKK
jgi:hypothetical protein